MKDHYYLDDNAASLACVGHYAAAPAAPFTAITMMTHTVNDGNHAAGMFIGEATPGAMDSLHMGSGGLSTARITNPTSFGSGINSGGVFTLGPVWLCIRAFSSTAFDYFWSPNGHMWYPITQNRNPGITIGSIGMFAFAQSSRVHAAYDYLRIWNSHLTLRGLASP